MRHTPLSASRWALARISVDCWVPPLTRRVRVQASDPSYSDDASQVTGKKRFASNHNSDMKAIFAFKE